VKKCRVVHIITTPELGGAQKYALYVVSHLPSVAYESTLISGSERILPPDARRLLAVRWISVPAFCRVMALLRDMAAGWRPASLPPMMVKLQKIYEQAGVGGEKYADYGGG